MVFDPFIVTSITTQLLDLSEETSWVSSALKSTQHFLSLSAMLHRSYHHVHTLPKQRLSFFMIIMDIRKSVRACRMDPWRTPAWTEYSREDLPFKTTRSCLLLRNYKIMLKTGPEIPLDLWRRPACQTLSKAFDISSAKTQVAPDLLQKLTFPFK